MAVIVAAAVGTLLGTLTGLGVGGGSLLLLYLTAAAGLDGAAARSISLLFFFPAALVSGFQNPRAPGFQTLLPAIVPGLVSAAVFSLLAKQLDPGLFRKALGVLFLLTGFSELFHREKKPQKR